MPFDGSDVAFIFSFGGIQHSVYLIFYILLLTFSQLNFIAAITVITTDAFKHTLYAHYLTQILYN